jgi:hypothetical protein
MRLRDSHRDEQSNPTTEATTEATNNPTPDALDGTAEGAAQADPDELRRRASRLLELGDEVIGRALSQDSARFLSHNRQQGGQ